MFRFRLLRYPEHSALQYSFHAFRQAFLPSKQTHTAGHPTLVPKQILCLRPRSYPPSDYRGTDHVQEYPLPLLLSLPQQFLKAPASNLRTREAAADLSADCKTHLCLPPGSCGLPDLGS